MTAIADFTLTKQYADGQDLDEAMLDAAYNGIGTYLNTKLRNNLLTLALDSQGSSYVMPDTGAATYTASLFNKQYGTDSYSAGDVSLGTSADAGWASVDAVNASITFTPERIGQYRATMFFTHSFVLNATSEGQCEVSFRFTDGTSASFSSRSGGYASAPAANSIRRSTPITLTHTFDWADTNPKTITLQKWVRLATNVATNVMGATSATGEFYVVVEKI